MKRLIFIFRLPIPWASYQWTSALRTCPFGSLTVAVPLSFRHLPAPNCFFKRGSSRMLLPNAIGSMSSIEPSISKYIHSHSIAVESARPTSSVADPNLRRDDAVQFTAELRAQLWVGAYAIVGELIEPGPCLGCSIWPFSRTFWSHSLGTVGCLVM